MNLVNISWQGLTRGANASIPEKNINVLERKGKENFNALQ